MLPAYGAEEEIDLLVRRNDPVRRQRDAEGLGRGWINRNDLTAGDEAAIDVLVGAEKVNLVFDDRSAERSVEVVDLGVRLAGGRRQEKRPGGHRIAPKAEARRAVKVVCA
jgi:hypothetical protein